MQKSLNINYRLLKSIDELENIDQTLLLKAKGILDQAYAPYSGFQVGAAILLENGDILVGTNQENASYGLCLCAEQNVLAQAGSGYFDQAILRMAISAKSAGRRIDYPISPCGACRQVISEHEDRHSHPIKIILQGENGDILIFNSIKDLLPFSFSGKDL